MNGNRTTLVRKAYKTRSAGAENTADKLALFVHSLKCEIAGCEEN